MDKVWCRTLMSLRAYLWIISSVTIKMDIQYIRNQKIQTIIIFYCFLCLLLKNLILYIIAIWLKYDINIVQKTKVI